MVDAATGEVLFHRPARRPPAAGKQLNELLDDLDRERAEAEEVFEREVAAHRDKDRLMEEKFQEALRRAAEDPDDGPPPSPFDYD